MKNELFNDLGKEPDLEEVSFVSATGLKGKMKKRPLDKVPQDWESALLDLTNKAISVLRNSENFRNWEKSFSLGDITEDVYERNFFSVENSGWREALTIYELQKTLSEKGDSLTDPSYYLNLKSFLRKYLRESKKKENKGGGYPINESETPFIFRTPREFTRQMTTRRRRGGSIYDLFDDEETIREIREKEKGGKLINPLVSGIAVTPTQNLVLKAIQKHLHSQSLAYGTPEGTGLPEDIIKREKLPLYKEGDENRLYYVCLEPAKLTKEVFGRDNIGGEEIKQITRALYDLDGKFALNEEDRSFYRLYTIEKVEQAETEKNKGGRFFIACRSIFVKGLDKDYIPRRADELSLLSSFGSRNMSFRLYDLLISVISLNLPTQRTKGYFDMKKDELLERVSVLKSYDKNKARLETDFQNAVDDVERIGLVKKIYLLGNKYRIYPNPDWSKTQLDEAPKGEKRDS